MNAPAAQTPAAAELLEAAVFDLDGVVTRTARLHFAAWKQLFDDVLQHRPARPGEDHRPFSQDDYLAHVDGRPRQEGVRTFLASRGITLPEGSPDDPADAQTIHGLGTKKNAVFRALLDREGADVDAAAVTVIQDLRAAGVRVGIATSSRNGVPILARAGLTDLFDAVVDGVLSGELGLPGKPHPDIFLECARRLGASSPARALVVEDAASGVQAGRAGGFGLVAGIDRGGNWMRLREGGADWIARDMSELSVDRIAAYFKGKQHARPNVLATWPAVEAMLSGRQLAVFLDYDGTLTPIVARPDLAVLDEAMRETLTRLSARWPVQIVSGRGLDDVRRLAGIDTLWYAGSHGFDIAAPRGTAGGGQIAPDLEPEIHRVADALRKATAAIAGALVEDKRFSVAVHYRLVQDAEVPAIERAVDDALKGHPGLKKAGGKKVFEVRPAMDWDKGKALEWLLEATHMQEAFPIYIGDDTTDEDAFAVLSERGMSILVTDIPRATAARYCLQDTFEVRELLDRLASIGPPQPA